MDLKVHDQLLLAAFSLKVDGIERAFRGQFSSAQDTFKLPYFEKQLADF